jgi:hypothetical protein
MEKDFGVLEKLGGACPKIQRFGLFSTSSFFKGKSYENF